MSTGILQAVAYLTREVLDTSTPRELSGVAVNPVSGVAGTHRSGVAVTTVSGDHIWR
jgi:hypothetical protein